MKRRIGQIGVLLLLLVGEVISHGQQSEKSLLQPTLRDMGLRGRVCSLVVRPVYLTGSDMNSEESYEFDTAGNLRCYLKRGYGGERMTRYPLKNRDIHTQYIADYAGDIVEKREYDLNQRLISSTHYIYGNNGRLLQSIEYEYSADSSVVVSRKVSTCNKKGLVETVRQTSADEWLQMYEEYKYDKRGNLTCRKQTFYKEDGTTTKTTETRRYQYDKQGNWIRCSYYYDGKHLYNILREIAYCTEE